MNLCIKFALANKPAFAQPTNANLQGSSTWVGMDLEGFFGGLLIDILAAVWSQLSGRNSEIGIDTVDQQFAGLTAALCRLDELKSCNDAYTGQITTD